MTGGQWRLVQVAHGGDPRRSGVPTGRNAAQARGGAVGPPGQAGESRQGAAGRTRIETAIALQIRRLEPDRSIAGADSCALSLKFRPAAGDLCALPGAT